MSTLTDPSLLPPPADEGPPTLTVVSSADTDEDATTNNTNIIDVFLPPSAVQDCTCGHGYVAMNDSAIAVIEGCTCGHCYAATTTDDDPEFARETELETRERRADENADADEAPSPGPGHPIYYADDATLTAYRAGLTQGDETDNIHRLLHEHFRQVPINHSLDAPPTHDEVETAAAQLRTDRPAGPAAPSTLRHTEPILTEERSYSLDLRRINQTGWKHWFKRQQASMWTSEEIDYAKDLPDFQALSRPEQAFIKVIVAFFASADSVVADNLIENFSTEVTAPDLKHFLVLQAYMENVHAETYANILLALVKDPTEQTHLFNAVHTCPELKHKADWMCYWTNPDTRTFAERLVAFAAVEGIFFSGAFCAIFWLKKRGLLPGLSFANELIARDEGMHRDFAVYIHNERLLYPATPLTVRRIIEEAVDIECEFVANALPVALIGMNAQQMRQYVKFVADHLLVSLNQPKLYNVANPFEWMELISLQGKTNFFEKRVSEYALSGVGAEPELKHDFDMDASF